MKMFINFVFHVIIQSQFAVINAKTNTGVSVFYAKWQQLTTVANCIGL